MSLPNQDMFELPDWRVVRLYFDSYKKSFVMQRLFPVVDAELFEETITSAYQQPQSSFKHGQASIRACIISFLAFSARLLPAKKIAKHSSVGAVNYDALASKGQFLLAQILQEPASLEGAQAVTMLVSLKDSTS
jgi:hypothetical protein